MIRRLTDAGPERERPDGAEALGHSADGVESGAEQGTALLEPGSERFSEPGDPDLGESELSEGAAFQPHLDSFAGPLDLLLYLIHKNEIDIFDIPIRLILDQYLDHLEALQSAGNLDLANAGEFLVMASRLMEIKSRLLLPSHSELDDDEPLEEEIDDPRRSLVEQLLEYREIKEKAMLLQEAHFQRQQRFERMQHLMIEDPEAKLDVGDSTVLDLCAAFQRVLEDLTTRRGAVRVIEMEDIPLEDVIQRISTRLHALAGEPLSFRSLFERGMSVTILISHFLAVLEMARLRVIRIRQESEEDLHLVLRETQTPMISDVFAGAAAGEAGETEAEMADELRREDDVEATVVATGVVEVDVEDVVEADVVETAEFASREPAAEGQVPDSTLLHDPQGVAGVTPASVDPIEPAESVRSEYDTSAESHSDDNRNAPQELE